MFKGLFTGLLAVAVLAVSAMSFAPQVKAEDEVKVGILFSLSGTMAISETSLRDVSLMAIEEINAKGGVKVGGKSYKIKPVIADPGSNWPAYADKAREMITKDKVAAIFGCWTSVSRKNVLPVIEEYNSLLFYPVQYEGEEQSLNVFYTAASPNQQLVPAAQYAIDELESKKFILLGTDYVFPRTANKVLKAFLLKNGVKEADILETYTPFGHKDYQTIVADIKKMAAGGDAVVLSTINGDSNVFFYTEFANQGLTADDCPIIAFSVGEDELRAMDTSKLAGHLAAWNYFQSIDTKENKDFVAAFKAYCEKNNLPGGKNRVTGDPIEAAYFGVYVWAKAAEKAGSFDVDKVREAVYGMEFEAPGGKKKMHESNQHTYKKVYIGEIREDGQFDIVYETEDLVEPDSYSSLLWTPEQLKAKKPSGGPKK